MIPPIVADAITYASALSLLGCGITIIYMCTRTFNFAHASMCTWGFYIAYACVELVGGSPYIYYPLSFFLGALLGAVCYFTINRPLLKMKVSEITLMMSTLGYDLVLFSIILMFCDYLTLNYKLSPRMVVFSTYDFKVAGVRAATYISLVLAIASITAIHIFLTKTKFGVALRATVENPDLAAVVGIDPDKVYLVSWLIGGGLASLGGAVLAMTMTGTPVMGMEAIVAMFAASILGGLYSAYGGALGGFVVGITEYLGVYLLAGWLGPWVLTYRIVIPLIIMVIALLFFPRGLAGIPWGRLLGLAKRSSGSGGGRR